MLFLHALFQDSSIDDIKKWETTLEKLETVFLKIIIVKPIEFKKVFLQISLQRMSDFFEFEHQQNSGLEKTESDGKLSLYRSFDVLDKIFGIDYLSNEPLFNNGKERLYENAGVGVQSSYATIVLALRYLNLAKGSKFIDLGSGYGRVGLVVGLQRPDVQFIGFEFVKERVEIANKARAELKLEQHVHFVTQDIASSDFKIPVADTYYIFDSFSDSTYTIIMNLLQEIPLRKRIVVVTKGNSKLWMKNKFWTEPQEFNDGNLCIFRSRAMPRNG